MNVVALRQDESSIIAAIRQGDAQAFASVYQAYYESLCGFTNSFVRVPEIAEELVQDVFCRIWDQRASLEPFGTLRAYLFGAARNRALSYIRHERVGQRFVQRIADSGLVSAWLNRAERADDNLYHSELHAGFEAAVAKLTEGQRTVLTLRWHYRLSPPEIAETLGITIKGVDAQITRALKAIRAQLSEYR